MARSFFITRDISNTEDPTALEFFPPKGSDELHEALKEAFPFEPNLAARMRAAVIEFLLQEQQAEQLTPVSTEYLPSPQSTFVSTMTSPAITFSRSPQGASPQRTESASQPSQEALMDVWSLPNKPQAKIHTRRTMTSEEKKAYKQKRLVGACADCKRRRRKCEHNNPSGCSSIVPQKVGKHRKRVPSTATASKLDATMANFAWSTPAFIFDDLIGSVAMQAEPDLPSFDFGVSDFAFTPDLSDDWQLFPDLPTIDHNNYLDSWTHDPSHCDPSIYAPRAGLSQPRVSTGSEVTGVLSQAPHERPLMTSGENHASSRAQSASNTNRYASLRTTRDDLASTRIGDLPMSPLTDMSHTPLSRAQSARDTYRFAIPQTTRSNSVANTIGTMPISPSSDMSQSLLSRVESSSDTGCHAMLQTTRKDMQAPDGEARFVVQERLQTSRAGGTLMQAPLCFTLYAVSCALAQSKNGLIVLISMVIGALIVAVHLMSTISSCEKTSLVSFRSKTSRSLGRWRNCHILLTMGT